MGLLDDLEQEAQRRKASLEEAARQKADQDNNVVAVLAEGLGRLARGDVSQHITAAMDPRYAQIKADFNTAIDCLRETVSTITQRTSTIMAPSAS